MRPVKRLALAALAIPLAGCLMREPNYRNYGARPHEWDLPEGSEEKVFGPMPFDEVRDFVREKESDGWEVIGYEAASLPEDVMVNTVELDRATDRDPSAPVIRSAKQKRGPWTFDIPKTMDDGVDPPKKASIPPYLEEGVKGHRQKYIVVMRRWF
jgi:hypothetical protein